MAENIKLEQLVAWALELGLSTGHADTIEDLLDELSWQIRELQNRKAINEQKGQSPVINYIFSYYITETHFKLARRPWWNLWGMDKMTPYQATVRKVIALEEDEGKMFLGHDFFGSDTFTRIVLKFMGQKPQQVQLEETTPAGGFPTSYISTTGNIQ